MLLNHSWKTSKTVSKRKIKETPPIILNNNLNNNQMKMSEFDIKI